MINVPKKAHQNWQPRHQILKSYLDSLGSQELLQVRPDYWALRFGQSLQHRPSYKNNYNPAQLRDQTGRWAEIAGNDKRGTTFDKLAGRSRVNEAACEFQYKQDTFKCNLVRTPLCWASATERYAACLSGRRALPLRF
jgi:hypothetical protein